MRLIVYIDGILILVKTPQLRKDPSMGLIYLLENLGFTIGYKKCMLEPTQLIGFLGFIVDSMRQELRLPAEKIKNIRAEAQKLSAATSTRARKLSQFLGKLNAATRAVPVARLFYSNLQASLGRDTGLLSVNGNHSQHEELQWWESHLSQWSGRTLVTESPR